MSPAESSDDSASVSPLDVIYEDNHLLGVVNPLRIEDAAAPLGANVGDHRTWRRSAFEHELYSWSRGDVQRDIDALVVAGTMEADS